MGGRGRLILMGDSQGGPSRWRWFGMATQFDSIFGILAGSRFFRARQGLPDWRADHLGDLGWIDR